MYYSQFQNTSLIKINSKFLILKSQQFNISTIVISNGTNNKKTQTVCITRKYNVIKY